MRGLAEEMRVATEVEGKPKSCSGSQEKNISRRGNQLCQMSLRHQNDD
jgi:hypothetical protein